MKKSSTVSIRTSLLRNLLVLLLSVSITILAVTIWGARRTVRVLSERLIEQSAQRADESMRNFFGSIEGLVLASRDWWNSGLLDYEGREDLEQFNAVFVPLLNEHRQVTSMMVVHDEGFEYLLFRDLRGGEDYEWYNRVVWADQGPDAGYEALWTDDLEPYRTNPLPEDVRDYDPRKRNYYTEPPLNEIFWTNPYYFFITKDAGLTATLKWKDEKTGRTRLVAFDLLLMDLSRFTARLRPSPHGKVFVLHSDGSILGLPADERWSDPDEIRERLRNPAEREGAGTKADDAATLLTPTELDLDNVAKAASLLKIGNSSDVDHETRHFRFKSGGEYWWGGFRPFDLRNQRLWIGVVVPERDFLGPAIQQRNLVLLICAIALVVATLMVVILARRYSEPLEQLAAKSDRIRHLDLSEDIPVHSSLTEVSQLADAHAQMTSALDSFSRYVPLELVRELLQRGEVAQIGGRTEALTILFTDIEGFTNLAEGMEPDELTHHMAEYFSLMLAALNEQNATVDKFIGDAIVAFWGAPSPDEDHAKHGVSAVLQCRDLLREHNERWMNRGQPVLLTRFGLSTGEAVVGNVGSPDRLNYTVLGDTVNTAARLESLNNYYGTEVLATESVVTAAGPGFEWRRIDRVRVKGKTEATVIFEPLGHSDEVASEELENARRYEEALDQYAKREFSEALQSLKSLLSQNPEDGPTKRLYDLCHQYSETPPGDKWDGVTRYLTK
ncbi:MAG: hypothetical protein KC994_18155 [Candidatus Omnitrophica bacterium]|nr:hypothetical protein [Candidatus Omnitrophota bacterium]